MKNEIPKWMEEEVAAYGLEMSPAPATVLDIGANIGAFTLRARAQWPKAAIRCYEPVAENYLGLMENTAGCTGIQAYRFAVRNFCGHDKILMGELGVTCGFHQLGRQTNVTERVMCVDAAEIAGAELVKIDTEGCEVEITSRLNLAKTRALIVEYHRQADIEKITGAALKAGLRFLEQIPGSANHGVLKFGRQGTKLPQTENKKPLTEGNEGNEAAAAQAGRTSQRDVPTKLSARKIYCAVASHFSNHDLVFLQSMMQLLLGAQVRMSFGWSCDPSVERARNVLTANFLASDCTHLLFVDSDIAFTPSDVMRIVSHDEDVVGGIYPLKTMDREVKWCGNQLMPTENGGPKPEPKLTEGNKGKEDGCGAAQPYQPGMVRSDGLQEVGCIGTGFMCLARRAFEKILKTDGEKIRYTQDWPPHREEYAFWRQTVREVSGQRRFLTEDWNFCYRYRELGGKIFADTRVILRHAGRAVWPLDLQMGNPFVRSPDRPNAAPAAPEATTPGEHNSQTARGGHACLCSPHHENTARWESAAN